MKSFFKNYLLLTVLLSIGVQLGANVSWRYDIEAVEMEEFFHSEEDDGLDSDQLSSQEKQYKHSGGGNQRIPDFAFGFLATGSDLYFPYPFSGDIEHTYRFSIANIRQRHLHHLRSFEPPKIFILLCSIKGYFPKMG